VTSRWSPGPPGTGMPAGRGDRVSEPRGSPRKYQRRISAAFLRPAPHSRRLMRAPVGEQGEGIISEDSSPGINSHVNVNDPSRSEGRLTLNFCLLELAFRLCDPASATRSTLCLISYTMSVALHQAAQNVLEDLRE
jgi:hypothetical protein